MASKPLTTEAIALTEKKMDMTLDDIIKMSKKTTTKEKRPPRLPIKSQGLLNGSASQRNNKVQRFMDSRSSIRQGVLAQRRSNFRGSQFPLTTNVARKAAVMPIRSMAVNRSRARAVPATVQRKFADDGFAGKDKSGVATSKQRPQTLDALFSNMKENRLKVFSAQQQQQTSRESTSRQRRRAWQQQQQRGGRGPASDRWGK